MPFVSSFHKRGRGHTSEITIPCTPFKKHNLCGCDCFEVERLLIYLMILIAHWKKNRSTSECSFCITQVDNESFLLVKSRACQHSACVITTTLFIFCKISFRGRKFVINNCIWIVRSKWPCGERGSWTCCGRESSRRGSATPSTPYPFSRTKLSTSSNQPCALQLRGKTMSGWH